MMHPEYLLVPLFMLADYYLTLLGASLYGRTPEQRAAYELNPAFQREVAALQLFSARHLIMIVGVTAPLYAMAAIHPVMARFAFGLAATMFALLVGGHITNIATLLYSRERPSEVRGVQATSYRFRLTASAAHKAGLCALPLTLLALFEPLPFILGAATGAWFLAAMPLLWRARLPRQTLESLPSLTAGAGCSFCGAQQKEGMTLLAGEAATICKDCVGTCVETLAEADPASAPAVA